MSFRLSLIAVIWGFVWAACLTFTRWGRWLAVRRTWITVVVGVGGNMILLWRAMDRRCWWSMANVFALSSLGIILRSLIQEYQDGAA